MFPAKSNSCLLQNIGGTLQLKVEIKHASLDVPRCRINGTIPDNVTVNYECCRVLSFLSPKSSKTFSRSIGSGRALPKSVAIVTLPEDAYHGHESKYGFYFTPNKAETVQLTANGTPLPKIGGLRIPKDGQFMDPYNALFTDLHAVAPYFSVDDVDNGFCIWSFDVSKARSASNSFGTCDLDIIFKEAPDENIVILVYCFYDSKFEIRDGTLRIPLNPKLQ
jgi:hypothetical protein